MQIRRKVSGQRRRFSLFVTVTVVLSTQLICITIYTPNASASWLNHDNGNVWIEWLSDYGRIIQAISRWVPSAAVPQTSYDAIKGSGPIGLVIDQDNYNHIPGSEDIAECFSVYPYFNPDDFTTVSELTMVLDDETTQKSIASFQNTGEGTGDPNDLLIDQAVWTVKDKDWAILEWTLTNIKGADISGVCIGLELPLSQVGAHGGVGYDGGDDIDGFNDTYDVYWASDIGGGYWNGTTIGFASAMVSDPITHYHSQDYHPTTYDDYKMFWENETWLYERLHAPNSTATDGVVPGNITSTVGWNGITIPADSSKMVTLVVAINDTYEGMITALNEARNYYYPVAVANAFHITEFSDSSSQIQQIEVFNSKFASTDLNEFFLSVDDGMTQLSGTWDKNPLPTNEYSVFTLDSMETIDSEGDTIDLYLDLGGYFTLIDGVSFGQEGVAPDPINDPSIGSVSRIYSEGIYCPFWIHSLHGMTFGAQNNENNAVSNSPEVVLNEVMFNPTAPQYGFIELMYIGESSINLYNFSVVTDDIMYIQGNHILDFNDSYFVILYEDAPWLFANNNLSNTADNVYLYDDEGTLLDMVGWNTEHQENKTVKRIPEGNGTYQGYDDVTSEAAGWMFDQTPTIPLIHIGPKGQFEYGKQGDEIWYNLTITNKMNTGELFDIFNQSLPEDWFVEIYTGDRTTKITDSDADGVPDIYIDFDSHVNISIKVTIPSIWIVADHVNSTITVRANCNSAITYSVVVQTRVYPYLIPDKFISPTQINVLGSGYDEQATITLNVTGAGFPTLKLFYEYQDTVLAIDSSGSMLVNDPDDLRIEAAKNYVDKLEPDDRACVVDFDNDAILVNDHHLSTNYDQIKDDIDTVDSSGSTAIGAALQCSNNELIECGDPTHIWVIILLTDGQGNDDELAYSEAHRAKNNGIRIYTIGLGDDHNEELLQDIAQITDGKYYPASNATCLYAIYEEVAGEIETYDYIAGVDLDTTDANPMITDVLPPWIDYVPGSFLIEPDHISENESGYTFLEWNVSSIFVYETWTVTFNITSKMCGYLEANNFTQSRINYTDIANSSVELLFPKTMINVVIGDLLPPELFIEVVDDYGNPDGKGHNTLLFWIPRSPRVKYYLIYRSENQTDFDFSTPWKRTDLDYDNGYIPTRTTWNDTDSAEPGEKNYHQELYYTIRAVDNMSMVSYTSRTVGKWTKQFYEGVNTFSIPLEPLRIMDTCRYTVDMNANYIKFIDPISHTWVQHNIGDRHKNNILMEVGKGFEVEFDGPAKYTFCGMPGAMIIYDNVSFGFNATPRTGDADSLTASVDGTSGDVTLSWARPSSLDMDHRYHVLRSISRDGFWKGNYDLLASLAYDTLSYTDYGNATAGPHFYYIIIPVNGTGERGASSYSIGVWTGKYSMDYDTLGLPLKLNSTHSTDWFCDAIPNVWGMNYYNVPEQRWMWHKTIMPKGAYDVDVVMAEGYQISTTYPTFYSYIGI
ncbi:MAG: VWA domain-containing protein [Thermoplasmata archaeon]|nr:MAG: VWA domain-containing protein [Thermoplasmata archaeon]